MRQVLPEHPGSAKFSQQVLLASSATYNAERPCESGAVFCEMVYATRTAAVAPINIVHILKLVTFCD